MIDPAILILGVLLALILVYTYMERNKTGQYSVVSSSNKLGVTKMKNFDYTLSEYGYIVVDTKSNCCLTAPFNKIGYKYVGDQRYIIILNNFALNKDTGVQNTSPSTTLFINDVQVPITWSLIQNTYDGAQAYQGIFMYPTISSSPLKLIPYRYWVPNADPTICP